MKSSKIDRNIFRAYDIRGIAHKPVSENVQLDPEKTFFIALAAGTYFIRNHGPNIALGYDCRLSSPELAEAFMRGLAESGCFVSDLGLATSPMTYFAACQKDFDGAVCITASHNPKEYNGIKLVGKGAHSICGEELQKIYEMIEAQDFLSGAGSIVKMDMKEAYLANLRENINMGSRKLKIVVDCGNGATGHLVKECFSALGCEVKVLFGEPDGNFPNHVANPEEEENMQDLKNAVLEGAFDFGIGFDTDGDRIGIVDEKGVHRSADLLLLLLARDLLSRHKGAKIVFDVKVSNILIRDIEKHGGEPVMTKTGHSFIEQTMRQTGALLGGEISGHMFFAENHFGYDDALLAACKILEIASHSDKPFSEFFADLPKNAITPEYKSYCSDDEKFQIVEKLKTAFLAKYPCTIIDGVRVNFDENSWGAVRCSNTSPNLTIRMEASDKESLLRVRELMLEELKKYPQIDLWWADLTL